VRLLGLKARQAKGTDEESLTQVLREMLKTLPARPHEVLGLLSTAETITRYLSLPSESKEELQAMALYQLEGILPYPIQECVTCIKVLGPAGEATRVLVAAVHRPVVERLLRIAQRAGLDLSGIASSSEAIGQWHRFCWPGAKGVSPNVLLAAEITREGIELGVLVKGSLVYMRQVPPFSGDVENLVLQLQETIRAYEREKVGPPVEQVTLSGSLESFKGAPLERVETLLELPVYRVDPLEASPLRESLSVTAQEFSTEISFSELLGAACAPRLLGLDLLPLETRWQQAKDALVVQLRRSVLLLTFGFVLAFGWVGAKMGATWWRLHQIEENIRFLEPRVFKVQAMADSVKAVQQARETYALQLRSLTSATEHLSPGTSLQFLGLESNRSITLKGTAPDLESVTGYSAQLRRDLLWREVSLRSAKKQAQEVGGQVEFEILLKVQEAGEGRKVKGQEKE